MSCFCFSPEIIDLRLLQLWLHGFTVSQATSIREETEAFPRDILELDTADHFRLFEELQPSLEEPRSSWCLIDISPSARRSLSETFYSFDDAVIREYLGRKLTTRARKDLDDVSETTGILRRSCLRQFDNLKRLYDAGEEDGFQIEHPSQKRIADVLGEEFCLPKHLMIRYEAILFLMHHRFSMFTAKKKSGFFGSLRDFEYCALTILNNWCVKAPYEVMMQSPSVKGKFISEGGNTDSPPFSSNSVLNNNNNSSSNNFFTPEKFSPFDFDSILLTKFRDLKTRVSGNTSEVWSFMVNDFNNFDQHEKKWYELRFKSWYRGILNCATSKDLKDFFEDLIVNVVGVAVEMKGTDLEKNFEILDRAVVQSFTASDFQTWNTLLAVVKPCTLRIAPIHPGFKMFQQEGSEDQQQQ